jgi:molecular chaperone GrpE
MADDQLEKKSDEQLQGAQPAAVEPTEIERLQQEAGAFKEKYIRLMAEFDNVRKRNERERLELIKYAHEEVIVEMLGFYEDFERCVAAARQNPHDSAALLKGVEMTLKRMQELLKKYDVRPIEAIGKPFDHNLHEALMMVESADHEDGTVAEVFQNGYTLGDRVVRTAKVKVARRPEEKKEEKVEEHQE